MHDQLTEGPIIKKLVTFFLPIAVVHATSITRQIIKVFLIVTFFD